jgi:ornithine carbamoyltransferase
MLLENLILRKEYTIVSKSYVIKDEYTSIKGKFENVIKVKYTGEILYNVLMEEYSQMRVNNLICETLHPNNIIAKLYTKKCKYTDETRDKIVVLLTKCIQQKDYKTYNKIVQRC